MSPATLEKTPRGAVLGLNGYWFAWRTRSQTGRANLLYIINNDPTILNNAVLGYSRAAAEA